MHSSVSTTTFTTTRSISPGSCQHGGVFNNGRCYCQKYWTGQNCELVICMNGATQEPNGVSCRCRRGYTGNFCEQPQCDPIMPANYRSADNRTFALVLDGTSSSLMMTINADLATILTTVLTKIQKIFPYWFSRYVGVVAFDAGASNETSATIAATTIADFAAQMAAALPNPPYFSGSCPKSTLTGLIQVLNSPYIGFRDEVFVVTAASAGDWIKEGLAVNAITKTHPYVNIIQVADSPCGFTYQDPGIAAFFNLTQISGGGYYQITPPVLTNFWSTLMSTYYSSSWLTFSSYVNCANIYHYVKVGVNTSLVTLDMYSIDPPTLSFMNPNGTYFSPNILYSGQYNTLDQFQVRELPGIYILKMNFGSTTKEGKLCLVKTRGSGSLMVYVGFTQNVGIDNGVHSDQVSAAPVAGTHANALVASVTGGGVLSYVQFLDLSDGTLLWASPLQMRVGCAFLYISNVFTCPRLSFAIAVDGTDFEGLPIRRINIFHCAG